MKPRIITYLGVLAAGALAAGCAADGTSLATASVAPEKTAQAAKVDPVCIALASQIDALRTEGAVERLEKAAEGKSANVQVKRASLAKQAELNKAYADFQTKCGPKIPAAQSAAVTAPVAKPAQTAAATTPVAPPVPAATAPSVAVQVAPAAGASSGSAATGN